MTTEKTDNVIRLPLKPRKTRTLTAEEFKKIIEDINRDFPIIMKTLGDD